MSRSEQGKSVNSDLVNNQDHKEMYQELQRTCRAIVLN